MEEEPVENVPDTEVKDDFIISQNTETKEPEKHENVFKEEVFEDRAVKKVNTVETTDSQEEDEFDLSDISAQPKIQSREDIIAAAEAAAFAEEQGRKEEYIDKASDENGSILSEALYYMYLWCRNI